MLLEVEKVSIFYSTAILEALLFLQMSTSFRGKMPMLILTTVVFVLGGGCKPPTAYQEKYIKSTNQVVFEKNEKCINVLVWKCINIWYV